MVFKYFLGWMGGWVGGWLEKWGLKLISTQVVVEVEVGVELGNFILKQLKAFATYFVFVRFSDNQIFRNPN